MKNNNFSHQPQIQQDAYDTIFDGLSAMLKNISIHKKAFAIDIVDLVNKVSYNHPELFYVDFSDIYWRESSTELILQPKYYFSPAEVKKKQDEVEKIASKILARISGEKDYEKELSIHDLLVKNVKYDFEACAHPDPNYYMSNTILGVLYRKKAVCEGIAKTVKFLFDRLGIPCFLAVGEADGRAVNMSEDSHHAWNIVQIDGEYAHLDVTWDLNLSSNGNIHYDYFNLSDKQIGVDHKIRNDVPTCPENNIEYYRRNGLLIHHKKDLTILLQRALRLGRKEFAFRVDPNTNVSKQQLADTCINAIRNAYPLRFLQTSYSYNEQQRVFSLKWYN